MNNKENILIDNDPQQELEEATLPESEEIGAEPEVDDFSSESDSIGFTPKKKRRYKKIAKKVATSAAGIALLGVGLLLGKNKY